MWVKLYSVSELCTHCPSPSFLLPWYTTQESSFIYVIQTSVRASSSLLLCLFSAFVALFTLPKVYESNKAQIDQNLDVVRSRIADITSK